MLLYGSTLAGALLAVKFNGYLLMCLVCCYQVLQYVDVWPQLSGSSLMAMK